MDQISILSAIMVSFPDAIMVAIIGTLVMGKFFFIKDKQNILRIIIFAIIATTAFYFIRRTVNNINEQLILSILLYSLLFIFIMKFKFYESLIASILTIVVIIIIEAIYVAPLLGITRASVNDLYTSDIKRFLYSFPERGIQIALIFLSIKFKIKIVDFESKNIKKKEYYAHLFVTLVATCTLIFLAAVITKILLFDNGDYNSSTNLILLRLNVYITIFVTVVLIFAIKHTNEFCKNKNALNNNELIQSLDYINNLIHDKNYDEAKEILKNMRDHISSE